MSRYARACVNTTLGGAIPAPRSRAPVPGPRLRTGCLTAEASARPGPEEACPAGRCDFWRRVRVYDLRRVVP